MLSGPRRSRSDHYHLTSVLCEIPIIWRSSPSSLRCRWPSLDGRVSTLWVRWFGQEANRKPSSALSALSVLKSSGSHCRQRRRLLPGDQVVRAHRDHQIRSPPAPGAEQLFPREAILYKRLSVGRRRRQRRDDLYNSARAGLSPRLSRRPGCTTRRLTRQLEHAMTDSVSR